MSRHLISAANGRTAEKHSQCSHLLRSETTANGTGLLIRSWEDPVDLDTCQSL